MSKLSIANLKKTIYYFKRNGLRDTYLAALERLQKSEYADYQYIEVSEEEFARQKQWADHLEDAPLFSVLVPVYHTPEHYLREMVESVLNQSYGKLELIIADAGCDDPKVAEVISGYKDERIVYIPLQDNKGISDNTNVALAVAKGEYIGLLDHDDVLTLDALYEMAKHIMDAKDQGVEVSLIYSDEDKCDEDGKTFYEVHRKKKFNLDLILSNNYICHFMVMKSELMKDLGFRKAYDGAQDHDITLRAVYRILNGECGKLSVEHERHIVHIPKVLYHWRCHRGSTAANPQSKQYAYEAGGRAIRDFLTEAKIEANVTSSRHVGFFSVEYLPDVFAARKDVGLVGGPIYKKDKITGGIYDKNGECPFYGLRKGFSGYMNRAVLNQEADIVDIRNVQIRPELAEVYQNVLEHMYTEHAKLKNREVSVWPDELSFVASAELCEKVREAGYRILWMPTCIK